VSCDVVETEASVGGGAFPTARILSYAVALQGTAGTIEQRLRSGVHAVIGRIANGRVLLDMRSVPAAHDEQLVRAVITSLT
jgi:L-seryl-tRNA(Ser) seleniumtransferase